MGAPHPTPNRCTCRAYYVVKLRAACQFGWRGGALLLRCRCHAAGGHALPYCHVSPPPPPPPAGYVPLSNAVCLYGVCVWAPSRLDLIQLEAPGRVITVSEYVVVVVVVPSPTLFGGECLPPAVSPPPPPPAPFPVPSLPCCPPPSCFVLCGTWACPWGLLEQLSSGGHCGHGNPGPSPWPGRRARGSQRPGRVPACGLGGAGYLA